VVGGGYCRLEKVYGSIFPISPPCFLRGKTRFTAGPSNIVFLRMLRTDTLGNNWGYRFLLTFNGILKVSGGVYKMCTICTPILTPPKGVKVRKN